LFGTHSLHRTKAPLFTVEPVTCAQCNYC
jgi:hypothetical protein